MKTIFIIIVSCAVLASCGSPFDAQVPIEVKPADSTQHKFIKATRMRATFWSDDDDPKDPIFFSDGIAPQDSVQVDTTYSSAFLKLRVKRDFYPRPFFTDGKLQIRSIEFYVKAIEVNGKTVALKSLTSGFGARVDAIIQNPRGGGFRDTTFVTDNVTIGRTKANEALNPRTIICIADIQLPYDEKVRDNNHNFIHMTYQITY